MKKVGVNGSCCFTTRSWVMDVTVQGPNDGWMRGYLDLCVPQRWASA